MNETIEVSGIGSVEVTFTERGSGTPVIVLHGGAGPMSVVPWAELLASKGGVRVLTPTHPGFMGTLRPEALKDIGGLAEVYAAWIRKLGLEGAVVIGNSIGGWIAAELALRAPALVKKLILVDAVGIDVPGHPVADPFTLSLEQLMNLSYFEPAKFRIDPSKLPPQVAAAFAGNRAALKVYASNPMNVELRARLKSVKCPSLVVWGEADRVADATYGQAFADAIPGARFQLLKGTGHVPQVETPALLVETVSPFMG